MIYVLVALAMVVLVIIVLVPRLSVVAAANEILVLSGRSHLDEAGRVRDYRVVPHGRALRVPVVETLHRLDTAKLPVSLSLADVHTAGGGLVSLQGVAHVRISSGPEVHNAIERFLDRQRQEVAAVAASTLEGIIREAASSLPAQVVAQDELLLFDRVLRSGEDALKRLGLHFDDLKLQGSVWRESSRAEPVPPPATAAPAPVEAATTSAAPADAWRDGDAPPWAKPPK